MPGTAAPTGNAPRRPLALLALLGLVLAMAFLAGCPTSAAGRVSGLCPLPTDHSRRKV